MLTETMGGSMSGYSRSGRELNDSAPKATSSTEGYIFESRDMEYDELIGMSKQEGKPLLLYFTGYGSMNATRMNQSVLSNTVIATKIKNNYLLVPLYIDDRTPLENEFLDSRGKKIKTIGQKNFILQLEKFQCNYQPFFAIVNKEEEIVGQIGYADLKAFNAFLESGMDKK